MEAVEVQDIVIVGAGIAGLTTSLGLHRVNSVVAKWLGFKNPVFTGRYTLRGHAFFNTSHGFEPKFMQFLGEGVRSGVFPCDGNTAYWYFTCSPTSQEKDDMVENPAKIKQFVMSKLGKMPNQIKAVIENTELDGFLASHLRYRHPWELLCGNISEGNACVAGDALHPMTLDIGQRGCAALEDGVVLARCLGEAILEAKDKSYSVKEGKEEYLRIEMGLKKYARMRKWRSFELIATSNVVGLIQQSDGRLMNVLRDKCLARFLAGLLWKLADFDCGSLSVS